MALDTYSDLQTEIAGFLNRSGDPTIVAEIPTFIRLTEAEIRRRLKYTSYRTSIQLDDAVVAIPTDAKAIRSLRLVSAARTADVPLEEDTPEALAERRAQMSATGRPRFFSAVGGELLLVPAPDQTYDAEIIYYTRVTPLSGSVVTNEVLDDAPDAYLYGALMQAAPFLEHDERIPMWESKFEKTMFQLEVAKDDEEYGASLRQARPPVAF